MNKITERYLNVGKKLNFKHLSPDCRQLMKNAEEIIDINIIEDTNYKILTNDL